MVIPVITTGSVLQLAQWVPSASVAARVRPTQLPFPAQHPRRIDSKCTRAHLCVSLGMLVLKWAAAAESDCATDHHKAGLKSTQVKTHLILLLGMLF